MDKPSRPVYSNRLNLLSLALFCADPPEPERDLLPLMEQALRATPIDPQSAEPAFSPRPADITAE